jgi:hypothetical protein
MLAYVANSLAGQMGNLLVGAILAVLLHALNMILGVFAPTIHALRLHYVEFFTKFFEPGGRRFDPFRSTPAPPPSDRPETLSPESGALPRRTGSARIESHHSPAEVHAPRRVA